jgi:hypothetical protein
MSHTDLLTVAVEHAARGWPVFPLRPSEKVPAIPAAHPPGDPLRGACQGECGRLGHGLHDATTDEAAVRHWWRYCPAANVGVSCGPAGLLVVDLDTMKHDQDVPPEPWALPGVQDGMDVLAILAERYAAPLPVDTRSVRTWRGGTHLYFRQDDGDPLGCTTGGLGWKLDTRGRGGYVVAPGSTVHGRAYTVNHDTAPARLPGWLRHQLTATAPAGPLRRAVPARVPPATRPYVAAALRGEVQRVLDAAAGTRNDTLVRAAYALARFTGAGHLPGELIESALQAAAEDAGLPPREAAATIRSGLTAGLRTNTRGGAA